MTEPLTISSDPLEPGMDYTRLRDEAQLLIARLADQSWTDYNTTDPGITLLESLCYAITDLGYRLGFDMQDLLAANPNSHSTGKQFFSAREILPVNPLTINDYRNLLIDIDGVKNAWLEKAESAETPVVYDRMTLSLSFPFDKPDFGDLLRLNGLYRVLIELDGSRQGHSVIEQVKKRLHQFRNVSEDFSEVRVLGDDEITITGDIEVHRNADVNEVLAEVYIGLAGYLSPAPTFYTLEERLASGSRVEDIFRGPILKHGFLDDDELSGLLRRTELHAADLIAVLLDIDGITAVRKVRLSQGGQAPVDWVLKISDPDNTRPVLKPVVRFFDDNDITFSTHERTTTALPDKNIVIQKVEEYQARQRKTAQTPVISQDLSPPAGRYRNLTDFVSVQNELPCNYGVGRHGLSDSTSELRQAQARQLQAYLMVFDQLLANYLAQLANTRELFAVRPDRGIASAEAPQPTYFTTKLPPEISGVEDIIMDYDAGYPAALANIVTDPDIDTDRMNRLLNHLLARHGQDFTSAATLYPSTGYKRNSTKQVSASVKVIPAKQRFLQEYSELSRDRSRGFNYTDENIWDTGNVAGLKKRISRLLDIRNYDRRGLASPSRRSDPEAEGFHMIEHILLRPDLPKGHIVFSAGGAPDQILCTSARKHELQTGDRIRFIQTTDGNYRKKTYSITFVDDYSFFVRENFVKPSKLPEAGNWVSELQTSEVISFLNRVDQIKKGARVPGNAGYATRLVMPTTYGLDEGDKIIINGTQVARLNGFHKIVNVRPDSIDIDVTFETSFAQNAPDARWARYPLYADPYSCQVSFIFPAKTGRARTLRTNPRSRTERKRFLDLVGEVIRRETPAHITPHLHWFEDDVLESFEVDYHAWLEAKAAPQSNSQKIDTAKKANTLLKWLVRHSPAEDSQAADEGAAIPGVPVVEGAPDPGVPDPGVPDPGVPGPGVSDPGVPDPGVPVVE